MVGWHHQLNGHEFEQTPGDSEGQGSLVCCSPWGCKKSDTTERLKNNDNDTTIHLLNIDLKQSKILFFYKNVKETLTVTATIMKSG